MSDRPTSVTEQGLPKLPDSWCWITFDDAIDVISDEGKRIPQSDYLLEGPLPVIDQGEQFIGGYTTKTDQVYSGSLPVIIFGDHTRRVKYVDFPFAVGAQGVKLLRPRHFWFPKFLSYLIPTLDLTNRGYSRHFQYLRKLFFPLAPLTEQPRVVAEIEKQFTRLDAAVAALERAQANLKRYRASVLKAACEGRLVPTEAELARRERRSYEPASVLLERILAERRHRWEEDQHRKFTKTGHEPNNNWKAKYREPACPDTANLANLPEGWCWATIDQLSILVTSGSRGWKEYYSSEGALFIRSQDIRTDHLKLAKAARVRPPENSEGTRTAVRAGDLLVTITGANVAKAALVDVDISEAYVSQHVGMIRLVAPELGRLIHLYATAPSGGRKLLLRAAYGAGKPGLNLDHLRLLPIPIPPIIEQGRINGAVEQQLSVVAHLEISVGAQVRAAQTLRQSVLKRAFAGKLVPQHPADEQAGALLERIRGTAQDRPKALRFRQSRSTSKETVNA